MNAFIKLLSLFGICLISFSNSFAQTYNMAAGTINTCSGNFYDPGGSGGNYGTNRNITETFCSNTAGKCIQIEFTDFVTEKGYDQLFIYNGPSTASPLIGMFDGVKSPGTVTSSTGCLTFRFVADGTITRRGWTAVISCVNCGSTGGCSGSTPACGSIPDICTNACNLGILQNPDCTNSKLDKFCLSNYNATAENPYNALAGCSPGVDMPGPAADVWYKFTTGANTNTLNFNITGNIDNPTIGVYEGANCNNLIGRSCGVGSGGTVNASVSSANANTTYYIQISGSTPLDTGQFELTITSTEDCTPCLQNDNFTVNPAPIAGNYQNGQTVNMCYTVSEFNQTNTNWLHGVIPTFGAGWDLTSFTPTFTPAACNIGDGLNQDNYWQYYNSIITSCETGNTFGPGWFFNSDFGGTGSGCGGSSTKGVNDGNPGNNYGDNCSVHNWKFCWNITAKNCPPGIDNQSLNVTINTTADSESGSWNQKDCESDPVYNFFATLICCTPPSVTTTSVSCGGATDGTATVTPVGTGPYYYKYYNASNTLIRTQNNDPNADQITGLAAGNYTVTVIDTFSHCRTTVPFTIGTSAVGPVANISITASPGNNICSGQSVTFNSTVTNGGSAPTFKWYKNGVLIGGATSATYTTSALNNGDQIKAVLTSNLACVTSNPDTSNTITMTVTQNNVSVSISASANPICAGQNVTFTATPTNGGATPAYQWKVNGVNVGANSPTYSSTSLTNGAIVTCVLTSNIACPNGNPATSNQVVMTVNPNLPVSVSISANNNPICAGTNVTFTAVPTNGGTTPVYQWKLNGVDVGSNSSTYSNNSLTNGDQITCVLTSNANCATGNPATSNTVTMTVNPNLPVSVAISANNNPICAGTNVTFTAVPTNGGTTPVYQWKLNGVNVGSNSTTYSNNTLVNGDQVTCVLTSNANCATGNPATSNVVTITVTAAPVASVSISADNNPICSGTNVTFTATPTNGGVPTYQWYLNNNPVGSNSATYSNNTLSNNDQIKVTMTSSIACVTGSPATSNTVTMTVNPNLPVSVSISANNNPICSGTNVTFTAIPTNGGTTPVYQWKLNGVNVGSNSTTYSNNTLTNGDQITCVLTSNANCATGNPATSNTVTMTVNPNLPVSVAISANNNPICAGTNVTFTAVPTNGGTTPVYQWKLNGANVGSNSTTYSNSTLVNGDQVTCVLTSNANCATGNPATSNVVTITVTAAPVASVSINADNNPICSGTNVTFTATPTNGGVPTYQWYLNNNPVGSNSATYSNSTLSNNDQIKVTMTSSIACVTGSPATSNTVTMTVNPNLPVSVSISANNNPICSGTNVTFTAVPTNGGTTPVYQWKLNGVDVGSNSTTYSNNTLTNGDQITCVLTSNANCATGNPATSNTVTMTVNPNLPVSVAISADNNPICAGTNVTFTAVPTNGGTTPVYQWKLNGVNVGSNSTTYSNSTLVNGDQVTCVLTSNANCATGNPATSNVVTITVTAAPVASVSINADNNPICSGTNVTFTATPTNGGVPTYQWYLNNNPVGSNSATYSNSTLSNNDQIKVTMTSSIACVTGSPATSNTVTMTVNPNLPVSVSISANNNPICSGTNVTFTAIPTNGGTTPVYQWKLNGVDVGSNSSTYSNNSLTNGDQITCVLTSNANCATGNPATSNTVTMTVNPNLPVSVAISANNNPICAGTNVTFTAVPTNGGTTPVYQWKLNGVNVGSNSTTYSNSTLVNGDQVTCLLTSNANCATGNPATSNVVTITVTAAPAASVSISADNNPICSGTNVTFTATPTNGGVPTYQWYLNNNPVGSNSATYSNNTLSNNDQIKVTMTSSIACVTGSPSTSNTVTMTVNPNLPVSVSISANNNPICSGTNVTFTAVPTNGGTTPVYQWKLNGVDVGSNSSTYSNNTLTNGDQITCVLTSNANCATGNPATSNTVTMTVNPNLPVSVAISADNNPICAGTNVTFTAVPTNGGTTPVYQWKLNGVNVGSNSTTYSNSTLVNGDQVTCLLTSNANCATGNPATSNVVTITVTAAPVASVSISADNNPICSGTNVTFTATPTNGGVPTYQWYLNNNPVGSNSATYSNNTLSNNDQIKVTMTSSIACVTGSPATSNTVTMTVNPNLPVSVSISANNNPICSGTNVTFTAIPTNGGTTPVYQWKLNGVDVGSNSSTYSNNTLTNGDQITCVLTSNANCATGNPATSNTVTMTVNPNLPVSVSINADNNPICAGTNVTFTAVPTNGGTTPVYQWKLNGANVGSNSTTYSNSTLVNGDQVTCVLTSNANCATGNPATSNVVTITVTAAPVASVSISADNNPICSGTNVTFTATPTNGGVPTYQWYLNNNPVGSNSATYSNNTLSNNDQIKVTMTSSIACVTGSPATSNTVTMTVNPNLPVSVAISANNNPICSGTNVTFTAVPTNGGTTPVYQWKLNGVNVGSNSTTYSNNTLTNGDQITCVLTSNANCATGNPATSNTVTMTVNPNLPVSVAISANNNPICAGTNVTFTAVPTNGGTTPVYQWKLNGVNVGSNSTTYSNNTLVNGDQVTCVLTSNANCATGNPVTSNVVTITVTAAPVASVSINADNNPICSGTNVTFTATPTNGGVPTYQWYLNNNPVGSNSATYSNSTLSNNDQIKVTMTSSIACVTGSPATSNTVTMTVNPNLPVSVSISANNNPICSGTNVTFTAIPTNGGTTPVYQWKLNGVNVGSNSTTYSNNTLTNGDQITCVLTSNANCATGNPATSNMVTMTVNPNLPVSVSISADNNPICAGTNVTFTAVPTNGGTTPVYQWKLNGVNVGSNSTTYSNSTLVNGDQVTCLLTSNANCATGNPATSNVVTITVTAAPVASVSINADNNPICSGTNVTFTATPTNGGVPTYQWYLNNNPVGSNSATYSNNTLSNNDQIKVTMTSSIACVTGSPATSNTVTMTVNPNLPVSVSISANNNPICSGTNVTFTAVPTNGGITPVYQWKLNGVNVGSNSTTYSNNTLTNGDQITCVLTSNANCATGNPATSNTVTMTVNPNLPVSVAISANNNPICAGTNVTFTAVPTNGGTTPVYQWKLNGVDVGSNSTTYSNSTLVNGDQVTCVLTSNANCATGNPATSNVVVMTVNPNLPVSVTIAEDKNNICSGTNVTFTAVPTNGGTSPVYQWKLNGVNVGSNSATYSNSALANGDQITCVLTSNANCATGNPATSNIVTITVNPDLPVGVSIVASGNPVCFGTNVTFTATPTNGGLNPVYQWYVNNIPVGANASTYSTNSLSNGDRVKCTLLSDAICPTNNPATSNTIIMGVNPLLPVGIVIAADVNDVCPGTPITLTATPVNGGTNPIYQWYVNGLPVGLNASSYTSSSFVNGDQVTCSLTSNASCATGNPAVSNDIDIVIKANLPVSVTISEDKNNICSGTNVTFTAVPTNGGTSPVYQWKLNGVNVGSNSATYSNSTLANGDQITCVLTSNANCATGNPATSNIVTMTVNPNLPVGVSIVASSSNICEGTNVTFTATPTNGGLNPVYQWYVNNIPVGTNSPTYSSGTLSMNDYVKVQLLSDALCAVSNPALSNEIKMIVHPNLPVSVGIIGNRNPACLGELVTFTATAVNGGSNPQYAWTLNGVPTGGNSNVLSSNSFIDGDKVKVTVTSNAICPTGNPAISNEVELDIQSVSPSISGDVDFCYNSSTILDAGAGYSSYLWSNGSTTQTTTVNSSGEVRVVVSNGIGCFGRDTVNVIEYAEVLPNITGSLFFCWDGSSVLDAGAGYSGYVWSDGSTTQTTTVTAGGNYSVTVEDVHGCFGSDAVVVEENAAILYTSQVTDVRCNGGSDGSISVTASGGSGSYSYVWSDGQTTNPATNLSSGDYSVTITDSKGCPLTTPNISVGEPTALALSLSNTSLGCYGDKNGSVTATVSGGTTPYSYLWTNGSTDAQITNLGAGTYGVAVVDGKGCTTTSSATLTEPGQLSFSVVSTDITCNGYNDGTISITNLVNAQGSVGYTLTPGVTQSGSVFGSLSPGGYVVVVKDSVGCSASTSATLTEPLPLLVDLGVSITLDLGETATLEPVVTGNQGSVGYAWTPTDYLSCVDCAQPTTTPLFDVVYTLVVEDQQGCTATDNIGVLVEKTRDIFVPTAFSPNGDGTNDVLQVMPAKSIERVNLFQVFNRWGEKVFEASNYVPQIDTNGWDGSYKEKLQNVDVYVYFVEVTFIDGITGSAKGQVTLMK